MPYMDLACKLSLLRQIHGDEVALRIHIWINSVKEPKLLLHKLNRNIMRCRSHPKRDALHHTIRLPNSQVMPSRYDGLGVGQYIVVVLRPSKNLKLVHRHFRVI
jgi:hypothetical protein